MVNPNVQLSSLAEKYAEEAQELPAFGNLNLISIKREVAEVLSLIGRGNFFGEYTKHDISHIDAMLAMLDWVVPESSRMYMSQADWLMVTLAIYFHDLGMLVTEEEFQARGNTSFAAFKDQNLFSGESAEDYREKVSVLGPDLAERFFYQEFVRHHHAERIEKWIDGRSPCRIGDSSGAAREIGNMLAKFDPQLREDLGIVCRSHHLDDLDDFDKYPIKRAYGNSDAETANLQYAAILLRTVDLLHMTNDRTPSIAFRTINPVDPISQREWKKQIGVKRVCSKKGLDKDGSPSETAPRDTIEVHAFFTDAEPFFALNSFLKYVLSELKQSAHWAQLANKGGAGAQFPWCRLDDDSFIQTRGFMKKSFSFELDQPRILKLLTGHTLYNDTGVVLRELVQNSLDAVRFQKYLDNRKGRDSPEGQIDIHWNSRARLLSVTDNGTGMTQRIIEDHLLTVGSSRYENVRFKEENPDFNAISRFGIGILSAFMIADKVDITTFHPGEAQGRQLELRNLLGKYLIRLIDKDVDEWSQIKAHGTVIRLGLRPTATFEDVEGIARKWIVVPECRVTLKVDDGDPVLIGYPSAEDALRDRLVNSRIVEGRSYDKWQVRSCEIDGAEIAYCVVWVRDFDEWQLFDSHGEVPDGESVGGICVGGVRIHSGTPGFGNDRLAVMANAKGAHAPRTNVARSGLEAGLALERVQRSIYQALIRHVQDECTLLSKKRSQAWALRELPWLLRPLSAASPLDKKQYNQLLDDVPRLLVEHAGERVSASPRMIDSHDSYWTLHSPFDTAAESLLWEAKATVTLGGLCEMMSLPSVPSDPILCGVGGWSPHDGGREVSEIVIERSCSRLGLKWTKVEGDPLWCSLSEEALGAVRDFAIHSFWGRMTGDVRVCQRTLVGMRGLEREIMVSTKKCSYVFAGTATAEVCSQAIDSINRRIKSGGNMSDFAAPVFSLLLVTKGLSGMHMSGLLENRGRPMGELDESLVRRALSSLGADPDTVDTSALLEALKEGRDRGVFDPWATTRN